MLLRPRNKEGGQPIALGLTSLSLGYKYTTPPQRDIRSMNVSHGKDGILKVSKSRKQIMKIVSRVSFLRLLEDSKTPKFAFEIY